MCFLSRICIPLYRRKATRHTGGITIKATGAIEIGPGKVLAGLGRRIAKEMKILSVGDVASLGNVAEFLAPT